MQIEAMTKDYIEFFDPSSESFRMQNDTFFLNKCTLGSNEGIYSKTCDFPQQEFTMTGIYSAKSF